jgi:hypothetical protein
MCLLVRFFLDAILGGRGGEEVSGAKCWAWWREVSSVGAIAAGFSPNAFLWLKMALTAIERG